MKYLFIVQGEGRGHLTQAISLAQMLRRHGHQVEEVLVGKCSNRELPPFFGEKIAARVRVFDSPSIHYGKNGKKGRIAKTIIENTTPRKLVKWRKSMEMILRRVEKSNPDVIVNFYEILAGLANLIYRIKTPMVSIGHQFLIDHPDYVHHSKSEQGEFMLRLNNSLCSFGTTKTLALSFYPLRDFYRERMAVLPPLLRKELFEVTPVCGDHFLGYLLNPGYIEEVQRWHKHNSEQKLHLFWDKKGSPDDFELEKGFTTHRINDAKFITFMATCKGYVTTAGFESICEAMYLGKPAMMIPAHIEQQINAADAVMAGAGIVSSEFDLTKLTEYLPHHTPDTAKFRAWVDSAEEQFVRHLTTLV